VVGELVEDVGLCASKPVATVEVETLGDEEEGFGAFKEGGSGTGDFLVRRVSIGRKERRIKKGETESANERKKRRRVKSRQAEAGKETPGWEGKEWAHSEIAAKLMPLCFLIQLWTLTKSK
jgi:hypothetical protein